MQNLNREFPCFFISITLMLSFQPFLDHLQFERRVSNHTLTAYTQDLKDFAAYMEQILNISNLPEIEASDIRTWIVTLLEDGTHSARTVNRKLSTLKSFYKYCMKFGQISNNPMLQIHAPKFHKKLPDYIDQKDMDQLFNDITYSESFEGVRDKLILFLFYSTGIRESELLGIQKSDINFSDNSLKVLGKRNKERIIPFGQQLRDLLTLYLEYYNKIIVANCDNYFIFVAANGKRLYPKAIYRIVRKYLDMVTTIGKRSPHVIRHTFATHMLNNGADLNAIKEILGHSSLAATQVYTHNSIEQLKNIYKLAHPRA